MRQAQHQVAAEHEALEVALSTVGEIEQAEAEVKLAPEPNFKAEVDALLAQVDDRTRIVYVSNPSNPTGSAYPEAEMRAICEVMAKHDAWLIVDDAHGHGVVGQTGRGTAETLGVLG